MRHAKIHTPLRILAGEETVREARCESIPAADAVFYFEIVEAKTVVELSIGPEDRRPIVDQRCLHAAQSRAHDPHVWKIPGDLVDHVLEGRRVEFAFLNIHAFNAVAEYFLKVFLVTDKTIDKWYKRFGRGDRFLALP